MSAKSSLKLFWLFSLFTLVGLMTGLRPACAIGPSLTFVAQPTTTVAGATITPSVTVKALDATSTPASGVSVTLSLTTGTGTLSGMLTQTTDASGIATFTNLSINKTGNNKQLTASATILVAVTGTSSIFTINPGAASTLAFVLQPPASVSSDAKVATTGNPVTVQLQDDNGNNVSQSAVTVTLTLNAIDANPVGTLTGPPAVQTNASGLAKFTNLSVDKIGQKTLTADTSLTPSVDSSAFTITPGTATQLAFGQQPNNPAASTAINPDVTVLIEDAHGNTVTTSSAPVTLTLTSGSGNLTGGGSTPAVNGVATFSSLKVDTTGSGKVLTANSTGLTSAASNAFIVTAGTANKLAFVIQPTGAVAGSALPSFTVQVEDAASNAVADSGVTVTVTLNKNTFSSGATTATAVTTGAGLATFSGLVINTAANGYTLTASATGLTASAPSTGFNVTAGTAAQVAFVLQPPATATSNQSFVSAGSPITVQLLDANNNKVAQSNVTVTLTLNGTGTLSGTTSVKTDGTGLATFTNLIADKIGIKTLTADTAVTSSVDSNPFTVNAGAAAKLAFGVQPNSAASGGTISPSVMVLVEDAAGNQVNSNAPVTLTLPSSEGTLTGGGPVAASNGIATFSNLSVNAAGSGDTLTAASAGLTSATSSPFNVTAGGAAKLVFVAQPSNTVAGSALNPPVSVQVEDAAGNTVPNGTVSVTVTLNQNTFSSSTTTATATTNGAGLATFNSPNLVIDAAATGYTLTATGSAGATTLMSATSSPFTIAPAATNSLAFVQQPTGVAAGATIAPSVTVVATDTFGNVVPGVSVTLTITAGDGNLSGTPTQATNGLGVATFSNLSINTTGLKVLTASGAGLNTPSNGFTITAGTATKITFTQQPTATAAGATITPAIVVQVLDANNNPVSGATITLSKKSGPGTLTGTLNRTTDTNGNATFDDLSADKVGTYQLTASNGVLTPVDSIGFAVAAGPASTITFTQQPTNTTAGGTVSPAVTVQILDASSNPIIGASVSLTLSNGTATPTGTLAGTTTKSTSATGTATFNNLTVDKAGSTYTLTAAGADLTVTSNPFSVAVGTASTITFTQQPTGTTTGAAISPAVKVQILDANGNGVSNTNVSLTLSNGTATPTGTLNGTATLMTDAGGSVTFGGLSVDKVGSYQLIASGAGLTVTSGQFNVAVGTASIITFTQQPTNTTAGAALTPAIVVRLLDSNGNPVPNTSVTLTLTGGAGTLGGTVTQATDAGGNATFSNVSVNESGVGYTLTAAGAGLTSAPSNAFTITAGAATRISFTQQPTNAASGAALTPGVVVQLLDANGNPVIGASVALALSSGTGTLSGVPNSAQTTDASGNATFSSLSVDQAGAKQLTASSGSLVVASNQFTITAGAASTITITQPPTNTAAGSVISPPVVIQILDAANNPVSGASVTLTLSNGTATPTGVLSGTVNLTTDTAGNATFSTLSINKSGVGYTLTATSGALTSAASVPFTVTAATAAQINFTQQPADTVSGQAISPVIVQLLDADANPVPNASVTLTLTGGSGTLSGTASQITDAGGNASFSNLSLDKTGAKTLTASSSGLPPVASSAFTITPNAATQIAFVSQPSNTASGQAIKPQVVVQLLDVNNNPVPNTNVTVSLTTGAGVLSGTTAQFTDANGNAAFGDLSIDLAGVKGLTATGAGLTSAQSNPFTVSAGAASRVTFATGPASTIAGQTITPAVVVQLLDSANNPVAGASVTLTLGGGSGTLGGTSVVATDSNGNATFSNLNVNKTGAAYTLSATVTGLPAVVSAPFAITAGSVNAITFTTQPGNTAAGTIITTVINPDGTTTTTPVAVQVLDANGNPIPGASVTVALASGSTGKLGGTQVQTTGTSGTTLGIATFTDLSVNLSGTKQITATSGDVTGTSNAFTIAPGPGMLTFTQAGQPTTTAAKATLAPVVVNLVDSSGNPLSGSAVALTLSNGTPTPTGVLSGTTTQLTDTNGNATFSNLSVDKVGGTYTLTAASKSVPPVTSNPFSVTAGAPASIAFVQQPTNVAPRTLITPAVTVLLLDNGGNPVPGVDAKGNPLPNAPVVSLSLASGSGTLTPAANGQITDANGIATFSNLSLDTPGLKQLIATTGNLTSTASNGFFVSNVAPTITGLNADTKSVHAGDPGFTLTINGSNFVATSTVTFNGTKLTSGVTFNTASTITAIIPAPLVGEAADAPVVVTSPASDSPGNTATIASAPAAFPIQPLGPSADTAGTAHAADPNGITLQYFNPGLQLFSVPFDYTSVAQTVNDVLQDFNPATLVELGNVGMLAVWDPAAQSYALTPNGAAKQLALGQGYWGRFQYQPTGAGALVETGLKTRGPLAQQITGRLDPQRRFAITLVPGWNMIGDPFAASVSLANVQAEAKDGTVFGLTDANNQGLVNQTFYKYATVSGATGYVALSPVTNDKLDPYVGYWVHAYQPCTLLVPQP